MSLGKNGKGKNGKRPRDGKENSGKDSGAMPPLIPQAHGGALLGGGVPGNRGNPNARGVPPSLVRAALRQDFYERRQVLCDIADGKVPLVSEKCPECGYEAPARLVAQGIERLTPGPRDRIAAVSAMAQFSDIKGVEGVSEQLMNELGAAALDAVRASVGPEAYVGIEAALINGIEERWVKVLARDILARAHG